MLFFVDVSSTVKVGGGWWFIGKAVRFHHQLTCFCRFGFELSWIMVGWCCGLVIKKIAWHIPWVVPPPRIPVTTRITMFLVGDPELNLHLPLLLGGGTTQHIPPPFSRWNWNYGTGDLGIHEEKPWPRPLKPLNCWETLEEEEVYIYTLFCFFWNLTFHPSVPLL